MLSGLRLSQKAQNEMTDWHFKGKYSDFQQFPPPKLIKYLGVDFAGRVYKKPIWTGLHKVSEIDNVIKFRQICFLDHLFPTPHWGWTLSSFKDPPTTLIKLKQKVSRKKKVQIHLKYLYHIFSQESPHGQWLSQHVKTNVWRNFCHRRK